MNVHASYPFLANHGVRARVIPRINITFAITQILHFSIHSSKNARISHPIPSPPHMMAIFRMSSTFSIGIQTFIFAQRLPPVNIPRKRKKNQRNQYIPRIRYDMSAKLAMISMSVVSFKLNAKPTIIPASPMR